MSEIIWDGAVAQAAAIRRGDATATEILDEYLDRIERYDPQLRAYVAVDAERAAADARQADELVRAGVEALPPFLGVTISLKDVIDVEGVATTHSSKALVDNVPDADGPLAARLRRAGFILLGKTNVPEFCTSMTSSDLNGICRNPWDRERTPSGSSGGAGAALAAGLCAVAHGTDGAGSVRGPASFCGVVGTKPTRGLVTFGPEAGNAYYRTSVDGVLSHTVRDAAASLDAFVGWHEPGAWWPGRPVASLEDSADADPGRLRIAVTTSFPFGDVDEECAAATHATGKVLEQLGHEVVEATPQWEVILAASLGPMDVPGPAGLVGLDQLDLVEPRNRPLVERGAEATLVEHAVGGAVPRGHAGVPRVLVGHRRARLADARHGRAVGRLGAMGPVARRAPGDVHDADELRATVQPLRPTGTEPPGRVERERATHRRAVRRTSLRGGDAVPARHPTRDGHALGGSSAARIPVMQEHQ